MLKTNDISLRYGNRILFENVTTKFSPGNCYGVIGANGSGKSTLLKILSGEIEPSWNSIPEQTTQDGTVLWTCRDYEGAPAALTVTVNPEGYGALPLKDIWVKSDGAVEFTVYGSYDGVNWRQIDEITVPHANRDNRHKRLENAYRFIRVSTETVATNEIEIVAGG
ncbi:hypothetical protein LCGC14_3016190 [marine sediment metagenome]|uniref:ABC transporter domain-containing protein n=1 Tax=marine sediment metagenome TaxID=412755 RepID=A0A0F8WX63_9ZZZZ